MNDIRDCESSGSLVGSTGGVHALGSAYPSYSICFVASLAPVEAMSLALIASFFSPSTPRMKE